MAISIQVFNPGKQIREALHGEYTSKFEEDTHDMSEEEEETPFNPEMESFKMTKNPMFSHQESVEAKED